MTFKVSINCSLKMCKQNNHSVLSTAAVVNIHVVIHNANIDHFTQRYHKIGDNNYPISTLQGTW